MVRLIVGLTTVVSAFWVVMSADAAGSKIPDAFLQVTVRQMHEGKPEKGFHILKLVCGEGHCWLTKVTLNNCEDSSSGPKAFYPGVATSSTREGSLVVTDTGNALLVKDTGSDIGGTYTNNFRFQYDPPPKKGEIISHLRGFSGGFVKDSWILNKVITVEWVPVRGTSQVLPLDCGVLAPGIEK